jgi:hypothetical protein
MGGLLVAALPRAFGTAGSVFFVAVRNPVQHIRKFRTKD